MVAGHAGTVPSIAPDASIPLSVASPTDLSEHAKDEFGGTGSAAPVASGLAPSESSPWSADPVLRPRMTHSRSLHSLPAIDPDAGLVSLFPRTATEAAAIDAPRAFRAPSSAVVIAIDEIVGRGIRAGSAALDGLAARGRRAASFVVDAFTLAVRVRRSESVLAAATAVEHGPALPNALPAAQLPLPEWPDPHLPTLHATAPLKPLARAQSPSLLGPRGAEAAAVVSLLTDDPSPRALHAQSAKSQPQGSFRIPRLPLHLLSPPGEQMAKGRPAAASPPRAAPVAAASAKHAWTPVDVGADIDALVELLRDPPMAAGLAPVPRASPKAAAILGDPHNTPPTDPPEAIVAALETSCAPTMPAAPVSQLDAPSELPEAPAVPALAPCSDRLAAQAASPQRVSHPMRRRWLLVSRLAAQTWLPSLGSPVISPFESPATGAPAAHEPAAMTTRGRASALHGERGSSGEAIKSAPPLEARLLSPVAPKRLHALSSPQAPQPLWRPAGVNSGAMQRHLPGWARRERRLRRALTLGPPRRLDSEGAGTGVALAHARPSRAPEEADVNGTNPAREILMGRELARAIASPPTTTSRPLPPGGSTDYVPALRRVASLSVLSPTPPLLLQGRVVRRPVILSPPSLRLLSPEVSQSGPTAMTPRATGASSESSRIIRPLAPHVQAQTASQPAPVAPQVPAMSSWAAPGGVAWQRGLAWLLHEEGCAEEAREIEEADGVVQMDYKSHDEKDRGERGEHDGAHTQPVPSTVDADLRPDDDVVVSYSMPSRASAEADTAMEDVIEEVIDALSPGQPPTVSHVGRLFQAPHSQVTTQVASPLEDDVVEVIQAMNVRY